MWDCNDDEHDLTLPSFFFLIQARHARLAKDLTRSQALNEYFTALTTTAHEQSVANHAKDVLFRSTLRQSLDERGVSVHRFECASF